MTSRSRRTLLRAACAAPALALLPQLVRAQAWPAKPIKIFVGASAGGGTDIISRALGERLTERLKQPVVIDNKPGASNTIAADLAAKSPGDGYSLLMATNTGQAIAPHLLKLAFDPIRDLTGVALVMEVPNVLVVTPSLPARNVAELIALLKSKPDSLQYASSGVGSTQHIAGEAFKAATGTKMLHVPYKGSSQAHVDLISGNVQMMFDTTSSAMGQIRGGKLRPLAVTTPKRSSELPDVPTLAESGVRGADMNTWYGLFAPASTPKDLVARMHDEVMIALRSPELSKRIAGLGGEPGNLAVDPFNAYVKADFDRFGKLIRDADIKV
jgi:tripartite-type tricarboxylate transporter receptor subunit TctC